MVSLKDKLLDEGLVSAARFAEAEQRARETAMPTTDVLVAQGVVSESAMTRLLSEFYDMGTISLDDAPVEAAAVHALTPKFASHYAIMPVKLRGRVLTVAVANPVDMSAVEDIETNLGFAVERLLAGKTDIQAALRRHYGVGADTVERILADTDERPTVEAREESHDLERLAEDTSVVRLVNQLLQEAIESRATDIHFEAYRGRVISRRRIDGVLYDTSVPENIRLLYPAIVSRIKLMSGLNIVERRMPQDGRARVTIGAHEYDLRISIVPAIHGEDVVIRILPSDMAFDLGKLGFAPAHRARIESLIANPHGIVFVTGPTGSGKSTTLYACLAHLNTRERKIITIEDPVEYEVEGITQTQVHPKIGLTFAHALRSMLRHDPDVMLVGEVRDRETAEIATQTAMTGHLVLSSLHTNDAAGGAVRLIDMGVDPYLVASTVLVFTAQRLVRVLCDTCREPYQSDDGQSLYRAGGCRACGQSGFRGRLAICEILPLEERVRELILGRASAAQIRACADELGFGTMSEDGWQKVSQGITTAEEVLRVTAM